MTTIVEVNTENRSYAHPLLSWPSVIFGTVVAVAIGLLLNVLVVVFEATATAHTIGTNGDPGMAMLGSAIWGAIANFLALFAGGFIAARAANHPDHHDGILHGLGVWALSLLIAAALLGSTAAKLTGGALEEMATAPAASTQMQEPPQAAAPLSQKDIAAAGAADLQDERDVAQATAKAAFLAFAGILIGLVAAALGGVVGALHPTHFTARPRHPLSVQAPLVE